MKYAITGASTYGVDNMGDDAMLATLIQGIKRVDEKADITFIARHPNMDYDRIFGFNSIKNLDHDLKEESVGRFFYGFNKGDPIHHLAAIKEAVELSDLFIIGGNVFMEISENSFLRGVSSYASTLAILSKFLNTPYSLYGVNVVDRLMNPLTIQHAKFLLTNAKVVTVRERKALEYLDIAGIPYDNVVVLGDPAFGIEFDSDKNKAYEILYKNNIKIDFANRKLITVSYRFEYWKNDDNLFITEAKKLAELLDSLVNEFDGEILFIPNCTYTKAHKWQDDRLTHEVIREFMKNKEMAHLINGKLNVFETINLFTLSYFHISNRRHSNVFAALNGKLFFALNVSIGSHMSALLEDLDAPYLMVNLYDEVENIKDKIASISNKRKEILTKLEKRVNFLKEKAKEHVPTILKTTGLL